VPGVVAAVVAAASWIGAQVAAVAAWTVAGIQIGSFIISSIVSFGLSKLLAPKIKGNDRQADTLQLSLGENPREALFGTVATGGQLVDAANKTRYSGYDNGAEILVIKLADHEIEGLVGFYVNDEYVAWTGSGTYSAFNNSFVEGLRVYLQLGTQAQTVPGYITTEWASFWPTTKTMKGCAHVFVEYADTKDRDIWPAGRPRFVWVVKGAKLYDPRKDSTVSGGSGSHRWGTPSTYEWSDNVYLCRYNWVRGIFNGTHLMVGRGLTAIEAPPERAIARANTCDETVSLKAGGTEKRYRANGMVKSTDTAIDVEEWFAAAMAGDLVDRDGVVDIDPGEARTPVWTITDGDMLDGETRVYNRHLGENQRVNTVVARYVEPTQRYEAVAAPMRRDAADVTADGRPYETTLDLQFVQSGTQAQRIAEIKRRQGRLERSFQCTVGPRYIGAESGDWVTLTSDRWLGGDSIVCVITAVQIGVDFKVTLGLREIAASVYSWTAASDELTPGTVVASSTSAPAAISVTSFAAAAAVLTTAAGSVPAIQCTWAAFTDASVTGVLLQVRKSGETTITPTTMSDATVLEAFVTAGVGAQQAMQVRAKAISNVPGRKCNWTSWANVTTMGSTFDILNAGFASAVAWQFQTSVEGWTQGGGSVSLSASNGILTVTALTSDPQFRSVNTLTIDGAKHYIVRVRAMPLASSPTWDGTIYYETSGHGTSSSYRKTLANPGLVQNQWHVFEWDMRSLTAGGTDWITNTITRLRLDLANSQQDWEVDWIAVGSFEIDTVSLRGIKDLADQTQINTAAAITGQKSGATTQITAGTSAPGSPATGDWWLDTNTTVPIWKRYNGSTWVATNPEASYLSTGGQIVDYRGLPINAIGPFGITRSVYDVIGASIPTTQITIVSHTVYAPGGNISVTGGTITGLTASTIYDCFWRISNSTLSAEVAGSTAANEKRAHPDYLWLATGEPGAAANEEQGIDRLSYGNYL